MDAQLRACLVPAAVAAGTSVKKKEKEKNLFSPLSQMLFVAAAVLQAVRWKKFIRQAFHKLFEFCRQQDGVWILRQNHSAFFRANAVVHIEVFFNTRFS